MLDSVTQEPREVAGEIVVPVDGPCFHPRLKEVPVPELSGECAVCQAEVRFGIVAGGDRRIDPLDIQELRLYGYTVQEVRQAIRFALNHGWTLEIG